MIRCVVALTLLCVVTSISYFREGQPVMSLIGLFICGFNTFVIYNYWKLRNKLRVVSISVYECRKEGAE